MPERELIPVWKVTSRFCVLNLGRFCKGSSQVLYVRVLIFWIQIGIVFWVTEEIKSTRPICPAKDPDKSDYWNAAFKSMLMENGVLLMMGWF